MREADGPVESGSEEPASGGKVVALGSASERTGEPMRSPKITSAELMKQEHKVESLNNCINELQQQAYAQRLDMENAHHGSVESRREQVRMQEELVTKEKALRETQIEAFMRWEN